MAFYSISMYLYNKNILEYAEIVIIECNSWIPDFEDHSNNYTLYFQRYPTDRAYFIAKEILMTERTYKKDLEILNLVSASACLNLINLQNRAN